MKAIFDRIPGWGWALITLILVITLAVHTMINPIVFGPMVCPERELDSCGKIRVVTNEGGHEFFSESIGNRGFFVVPIMNRLKTNHAVHLFLMEKIGDKETEIPLGGPISVSFANVLSQSEIELTVKEYNITKIEYVGGNVFTLVISLYDMTKESVSNVVEAALSNLRDLSFVSSAHAGDITDLSGFLKVQKTINNPSVSPTSPPADIFIGQSTPPADPAVDDAIHRAIRDAEIAQATNNLPLSANSGLRADVERETGFSIPDNHWQDIESPEGLTTYLRARAALAKKHPELFAPSIKMNWAESASKADEVYGEKYIFLPEATINSLNVQ